MSDNSDLFKNHQGIASDPNSEAAKIPVQAQGIASESNSEAVKIPVQAESDDIFSRPFVPDTPEETPAPESDFVEPTTPYGTPPELLESIDISSELRENKKNNKR